MASAKKRTVDLDNPYALLLRITELLAIEKRYKEKEGTMILGAGEHNKMDRISFYLPIEMKDRIYALSEETRVPVSALLRVWISTGLAKVELEGKENWNTESNGDGDNENG